MVAYDSRRALDPAQILSQESVAALRAALTDQRLAGPAPTPALQRAIVVAAREARARELPPETLLIQLKGLADEIGILQPDQTVAPGQSRMLHVREWMVSALLRAYWHLPDA
ncbi:MAG TPA: hypothetical protein VGM50_14475 [Gemmatimonadaceae bacterium]|jgi:hypothetical protein